MWVCKDSPTEDVLEVRVGWMILHPGDDPGDVPAKKHRTPRDSRFFRKSQEGGDCAVEESRVCIALPSEADGFSKVVAATVRCVR